MNQTQKPGGTPPKRRSWWHARHVVLGLCFVIGLVFVILVQLLYPAGKALPYARIGDSQVGGKEFKDVIEIIRGSYSDTPLTVTVPGKPPLKTTSSQAGIVPGYRHAAEAVTEYSLQARLIPFSFAYKMLQAPALGYEIDEINLKSFTEKLAAYCATAPKDASLVFEKGSVRLDHAVNGQQCEPHAIRTMVTSTTLRSGGTTVSITPKVITPNRTDKELESQFVAADATIRAGVTVRSTKDSWQVPAETIASWLTTEEKDGKVLLAVKTDAIKAYLDTLRGKIYIEPGTSTVNYLDGEETARTAAAPGVGIDTDVSSERIRNVLLGPATADRTAWVQLTVLPVRINAVRNYTTSSKGLQALLEQWDRDNSARYGLMVRDISGRGLDAALNPDRDFVTASTFKMFLAYAVLHKVETGELSMDSQTDMGLTARACIDEMILHSTNACALSLFHLAGWSYASSFIKSQFPSTILDNSASSDDEKHTTVRDETAFFQRLNAGQLMNGEHTSYLLDLFKRQVYRSGIPKGVPGVTVANKVGFYNGYKHDVGLVYASRGTYVLGYLSYGGNDVQIADLSRQVYALMNR